MEMVQYTVRPGNTLFGIAQFFQTTVNDILKYNNIQTPDATRSEVCFDTVFRSKVGSFVSITFPFSS